MTTTQTIVQKDFKTCLDGFLKAIQKQSDEYYNKFFDGKQHEHFDIVPGRKYIKVTRDFGKSVYCFIDSTNGDILKAASWKAPAPRGRRGTIFAEDFGLSCTDIYGLKYLI